MKKLLILLSLMVASVASAQVHVNGYTKKDGTYVAPHNRTAPDQTISNNYSTQGNVNPYTGKAGTVPDQPYAQPQPAPAPQPQPALAPSTWDKPKK